MNLLVLFLLVGLLSLGFAWGGRRRLQSPNSKAASSWLAGLGLLAGFALSAWALGFSPAFVLPVLLLGLRPAQQPSDTRWERLWLVGLAGWSLFSVYPFGEFELDERFIAYLVLLLVFLTRQMKLFSTPVRVTGFQPGAAIVGLLLLSYFCFEEHRPFPLVWLPLLLAWGLACFAPFGLKGVVLNRRIWAALGLLCGVLVLKTTSNLAEFLVIGLCFFPFYMDGPARRWMPGVPSDFSLAQFWMVERKWDPKLTAAGFSVGQFMLGLFSIQLVSFGAPGVAVFLALLFAAVYGLTYRETRLMAKLSLPVEPVEPEGNNR